MSTLDLNLLVPLQALLVEANVTRAAERTGVGQPAMSASLAKLRRHFDDPLLVRDGRGMKLTPLATSLLEPVTELLGSLRTVLDNRAPFDPAALRRTFTIITSDYVATVLIKPLLRAIVPEAPHVRINLVQPKLSMVSLLRRVECDLVIAPQALMPPEALTYQHRELFTDHFVVVADKDNDSVHDPISIEELSRLPYLGFHAPVLRELGLAEDDVCARVPAHFTVAPHLVAGSRMVALVYTRLFELFGADAGLRAVSLDAQQRPVVEMMFWHPKYNADPAHTWLRAKLEEVAATI
ncbi:LysR family transcriptional regulator [Allokutzneria albata]|uniref:DNA-binding transcriptional regulator, LysR family n=1 Tax=Allokutzneria albata TaxID=211114 RepID=A0A1G9S783_ALLAB|nr:LysR family transcriptional regulator [Allokutzneria albata]SDM31304.1 DNA-binding transcriptional regulator, LysR family [Allokutzneria albata]